MSHADEHITDPRTYRLRTSTGRSCILFAWDYPGATLLRVRVQRSSSGFAERPDEDDLRGPGRPQRPGAVDLRHAGLRGAGQRIVYEGTTGRFSDREVRPGARYYYTLWARRDGSYDEPWTAWERRRLRAAAPCRLARAAARLRTLLPDRPRRTRRR